MNFVLSSDEISSTRAGVIDKMLSSVISSRTRLNIYSRPISRKRVIGVSEVYKPPTDTDYRDWRFKSEIENFTCSYFEIWIPIESNQYYLDRAYFHLYFNDNEYVLLHSDPNEHLDEEVRYVNYEYKQSPHIHIKVAEQPLPHSHLALNTYDLNTILSNISQFDIAMEQGIVMIAREILGIEI